MPKANILCVDTRDDNSLIVYYSTGTCKSYKNMNMLPKTVRTWLDSHQAPQAVTVKATPQGAQIQTETVTPETMPEATEMAVETVEVTEPIECNFILIDAPIEAVEAVENSRPVKRPPCAVNGEIEPIMATESGDPEPIRMEPVAVAQLAALAVAYNGIRCLSTMCYGLGIAAEVGEAVKQISTEIRADARHEIHRTSAWIRRKVSAAADTVRTAVRRSKRAICDTWDIISAEARRTAKTARNKATQLTDEIKSWWCTSWEFRRQLVEAVTVVD